MANNREEKFTLRFEGTEIQPVDIDNFVIQAQFKTVGSVQPTIITKKMTVVGKDARLVSKRFRKNAFLAPKLEIESSQGNEVLEIMPAMVDFTEGYRERKYKDSSTLTDPNEVEFRIRNQKGVNNFLKRSETLTLGYLESIGVFTDSDYVKIGYKIEKVFNGIEFILVVVTFANTTIQLYQSGRRVVEQIAVVSGLIVAGNVVGFAAALAYNLLILLAEITLLLLIAIQFLLIGAEFYRYIYSPRRNDLGLYLRTIMNNVCEYMGYTFISPITELDVLAIDPSKPQGEVGILNGLLDLVRSPKNGIPNTDDFGYRFSEILTTCTTLANAELAIIPDKNEVHLRTESDPWWLSTSTFEFKEDPLDAVDDVGFNLKDIVSDRSLSYRYDIADEWTVENFDGNNAQVVTTHQSDVDQTLNLLNGFKARRIEFARGIRKDGLTTLEKGLLVLFQTIDDISHSFGKTSNLAKGIKDSANLMKKSGFYHNVPKLIHWDPILKGIPSNYVELTGAKALDEKYYKHDSFVDNGETNRFGRQRASPKAVTIPFDTSDFKKLAINPYFVFRGEKARAISVKWNWGQGKAELLFWYQFTYWTNGKELKFTG